MRAMANLRIQYRSELFPYLYDITGAKRCLRYGEQVEKKGPVAPNLQTSVFRE